MARTEKRGKKTREAVLAYCTSWTQGLYLCCWPTKGAWDATMEVIEETSLAVSDEMMAMLRHEVPASAIEPTREPVLLTGNLGSGSEPEIMAGSFLGTYGVLDIDTAGHWTYRAGKTRLRELKESGPDWFAHYDRFFVTHKDGFIQMLTISLCRRRNAEVKKTKASATVGDRVPGGTFGENNEPDLRLAMKADFASKLPDPDQFDGPAPVPLWIEGKPDDGMPRREVTQDELRHLRLYPERDELSGGGLKFEGLLFFNAAERLPVDETRSSDKAQVQPQRLETEHQRKGGRVSKYNRGVQEFVDRLSDKFAEDFLSLTLGQLESWLTENAPPEDGYEPQPEIPDFDDVEYYEETLWWKDARGQLNHLNKRALERYIARAKSRDRESPS